MAILSSDGRFEITQISFTPKVIVMGEETAYSITVKNKTGSKISKLCFRMQMRYPTSTLWADTESHNLFGELRIEDQWFTVVGSISWANNASKTFTGKVTFNPGTSEPVIPGRVISENSACGLFAELFFNDGDGSRFSQFDQPDNLYVVDAHYKPSITAFAAERSTGSELNDEGENLLMNVALSKSAAARPEFMHLYLYYQDKAKPELAPAVIDLTSKISSALSSEIATVISETLDKNADWNLLLWFGDKYESVTSVIEVSRAFANVHLSGAPNGGVCFGSFSKATENNPLFQCYYPAEFEAGIRGVTNYVREEIETGGRWYEPGDAWNEGKKIYRRVFKFSNVSIGSGTSMTTLGVLDNFADIETMVEIRGTLHHGVEFYPLPRYWSESAGTYSLDVNNGNIRLRSIGGSSPVDVVVELLYTKTTEEVS